MSEQPQATNGAPLQENEVKPQSFRVAGMVVMSGAVLAAAAFVGMLIGQFTRHGTSEAGSVKGSKDDNPDFTSPQGPQNLKDWKNPELVLVLSGEMHGYLLPCGCSDPQYGGLERRYNFIQSLKKRGWPVVAVDLGDLPQTSEDISKNSMLGDHIRNFQSVLKYTTAMKALKAMDYTAVGLGWRERALQGDDNQGLPVTLDNYALNEKRPRIVAANLLERGEKERWLDMVGAWQGEGGQFKVGVTGLVGPSVRKSEHVKGEKNVSWADDTKGTIKQALAEQKEAGVTMRVLLYQGTVEEAQKLAKDFPQFHVVLCLTDGDLAPEKPARVGETLIVTVGHKGHSIGVLGVFQQKPGQYEMRYQMVEMGPELRTPEGEEKKNPVVKLLNEYTATMKNHPDDYLGRYKNLQRKHPIQMEFDKEDEHVEYVGSLECKRCHGDAYAVWEKTPHARAYESLKNTKKTVIENRQYDAECVVCHVTGFGYKTGFTDEKDANFDKLKVVGCESCHGPGSAHVDAHIHGNGNAKLDKAMNPWKYSPRPREQSISATCLRCHDEENDVGWKFKDRWAIVDHPSPKKGSGSKGSGSGSDDK
jgi:hypothetical protein